MKIAICDDDIQFIDTTCLLLEKWANEHGIPLTFYRLQSGDSLILTLQKECIDLIFLDVVMPMLNGIETARELRNNSPTIPIVFLSSSREFAVDSYELKAFNYLLKPISEDRLFAVLDDFLKMQTKNEDFIIAQTITGFCKINFADVIYLVWKENNDYLRIKLIILLDYEEIIHPKKQVNFNAIFDEFLSMRIRFALSADENMLTIVSNLVKRIYDY